MPSPRTYTTAGAFRRALEERLKRASMADQVDLNRQRIGRSRFTLWRRNAGSRQTWPRCLRRYRSSSKECWYRAHSGERGMTENVLESLPFEPPEQENIRLREENARLRRLLAVHSIAIPQLAPENQPPTKNVETAPRWTRRSGRKSTRRHGSSSR